MRKDLQYLSDGPGEGNSQAQPDVPVYEFESWTGGDTVAHEQRTCESTSSARSHRK